MKNNTVNFWIKQIVITFIYLILLVPSYLFISPKISSILVGLLTTIFIWIMNITFAKDYQTKNDIKLETHKSKLSNYTLVTKLQFELEFKIYKEIYANLYNLYVQTNNLTIPLDLSTKEEKKKKLDSFYPVYNKVSFISVENRPFYSEKIYNCVIEARNLCFKECQELEISLIKLNPTAYFNNFQSINRKKKIKENVDKISILIRERIANMKIIED